MPIVMKFVEDYVGKKVERGVDPMECVAIGAAVQAAVLTGEVKDVVLLDVTPLSLGIETLGGVFTKLVDRNTTIPTKKSQVFSTATDNQPAVTVHVLQGERQMTQDNVSLGKFDLMDIPPAPRGVPQIEVIFDIDSNGIVHVTAKDTGTGKEQSIRISAATKLSKDEVEKFVKQAEQYADADKKKKEDIEVKNETDAAIYAAEKALKDYGDKVSQDERLKIEQALTEAKEASKGGDTDKMKKAKDALMAASHKLAEQIYQDAQAKKAQGGGVDESADGKGKDDNVVDAEVVDKGQK